MAVRRTSPARILAPLALVASFLALIVVVTSSTGGNDALRQPVRGHSTSAGSPKHSSAASGSSGSAERSTYTVRSGDNLSEIADRTGVSLEQLSKLNPALDPQALISGECVNLRTPGDCKH